MSDFIIHFLMCNIYISAIVIILSITKRLFKNIFSNRMQYNLWFILLGLLVIPFLPIKSLGFSQIFSLINKLKLPSISNSDTTTNYSNKSITYNTTNWMNDFTISVSSNTPSFIELALLIIWIIGIIIMIIFTIKSRNNLNTIKNSSLPLQNKNVHKLYKQCLKEMNITKNIPIYSSAFLESPIIVGLFKPCIYLPIHLISDYNATDIRYMLLHELQHYKYKDALANYIMNLAGILYWFNPFVLYALKEMCNDREIACDTSVLNMLAKESYEEYGNTLINFAEKLSRTPFPFATSISGNLTQIKRRILNIASYKSPSFSKKIISIITFILTAGCLLSLSPLLSTYAASKEQYKWNTESKNISYINLSPYFNKYDGCFVLYNRHDDSWKIYNIEHATTRTSPDSTYKIYSALFGLEENIITPKNSLIHWNKKRYIFNAWNKDHNLYTAMDSSVNWYFQTIDNELGKSNIKKYIDKINYGNRNVHDALASYWMESTLKISPIEQVELLSKVYNNKFDFKQNNINTVKQAICLSSSGNGNFYGKTGTGRVNGQDINGWFIGFIETSNNTYYFATNINSNRNATGSTASKITMSILTDMNIWTAHNSSANS